MVEGTDIRVRITWGGADEIPCFGQIVCSTGPISQLTPLGTETDDSGNIILVNGQVIISQPLPKVFNGMELTIPWEENGVLRLRLSTISEKLISAPFVDIPLKKLLVEGFSSSLGSISGTPTNNRLSVRRVPGDMLRVKMERDNVVYSPGEKFQCEVFANLAAISTKAGAKLNVQVLRGRETFEVYRHQYDFSLAPNADPLKIEIPLPGEEGIFDVVFSVLVNSVENPLVKPFTKPLTVGPFSGTALDPTKVVLQRRVQVITISPESRTVDEIGNLTPTLVVEIDPTEPKWWESMNRAVIQLPHWNRNTGGSLGSGDAKTISSQYGPMIELPSRSLSAPAEDSPLETSVREIYTASGTDKQEMPTVWEAYPLALERVGMPHILEVEYPAGVEQTLGISILEPNVSGAMLPMGIDSGIHVSAPVVTPQKQDFRWERHRIIFWPKSKSPVILMTNRHPEKSAFYGKIRISSVGNRLPRLLPKTRSDLQNKTEPGQRETPRPERLIAPMFSRPIFSDFFSATKVPGGTDEFTLTDWITFYDGARRMTEYMNYVGYNGLVLNIYADGGSIYPSKKLASTPRYDSGNFFNTGQDVVKKDVAEMVFRLFDREKLTLIPSMDFSCYIPELETAVLYPSRMPEDWKASSICWRNAAGGNMRQENQKKNPTVPYYNILNPRVQTYILECLQEVIKRYGHHSSFGGISLQLTDHSILLMPPPQWGMDAQSVQEFSRETSLPLPAGFQQQVEFLSQGEGLQYWLQWRAQKLSLFYRRAANLLNRYPGTKLYLVGTDFLNEFRHPELHPQLGRNVSAKEVLLMAGLDPELLQIDPRIVFPRPQKISPNGALSDSASELQWKNSPGTYRLFQGQSVPSMTFYHPPMTLRLPQFDKVSPYQPSLTWGKAQFSPAGVMNRRRFAESLAMMDAQVIIDGGWSPVLGQEEHIRNTINIFRKLPPERFYQARVTQEGYSKSHPVSFCYLNQNEDNYVYAVNRTPFSLEAMIHIRPDASLRYGDAGRIDQNVTLLRDGQPITLGRDQRGYFWRVTLAPYQIECLKIHGPAITIFDPVASYSSEIKRAFETRLLDLKERLRQLKNPPLYVGLRNANFEDISTDPRRIPQWEIRSSQIKSADSSEAVVQLDTKNAQAGNTCVYLRSFGEPLKMMSQPFAASSTGRMFISVWINPGQTQTFPPLQMILEDDTGKYRRVVRVHLAELFLSSAEIPNSAGEMAGVGAEKQNTEWKQYVFHVNDLPLEEVMQLRLSFELLGAGEIKLDNIRLSDMNFSLMEQNELARLLETLTNRLYRGDLTACISSLESYWIRFLMENIQVSAQNMISERVAAGEMEVAGFSGAAAMSVTPGYLSAQNVPQESSEIGRNDIQNMENSSSEKKNNENNKKILSDQHSLKLPSLSPPPMFTRHKKEDVSVPVTEEVPKKKKSVFEKVRGFFHL